MYVCVCVRASVFQSHLVFQLCISKARLCPVYEGSGTPRLYSHVRTSAVMGRNVGAGNRAAENITVNKAGGFIGTPYELIDTGMTGNAQWSGPRLRDVLLAMYPELASIDTAGAEGFVGLHVEFEGASVSVSLSLCLCVSVSLCRRKKEEALQAFSAHPLTPWRYR